MINQNFRKDRTLIKSDMLENNVCVMFQQIMLSFRCSSHSNIYVFYAPFICSYGVISLSTEEKYHNCDNHVLKMLLKLSFDLFVEVSFI